MFLSCILLEKFIGAIYNILSTAILIDEKYFLNGPHSNQRASICFGTIEYLHMLIIHAGNIGCPVFCWRGILVTKVVFYFAM